MQTQVLQTGPPQADVDFLLRWEEPPPKHWVRIAISSALLHAMGAALFLLVPPTVRVLPPVPERRAELQRQATPLIAPPAELTQRAPNRSPLSKEFNLESIQPRQEARSFPSAGAPARPSGKTQRFSPPPGMRAPATPSVIQDAPAIDPTQMRSPQGLPPNLGVTAQAPPPQIAAEERPKLAFESPGSMSGTPGQRGAVPIPTRKNTVDEAVRSVARGAATRSIVVGDEEESAGAIAPNVRSSPNAGKLGSSLELMSDPMGVDFWPYLIRVLASVRRNWYAVIPESAKLGRGGRVIVQFAISKDGSVPKLIIATPSGADALDRAAVAGISASNPFPPLPDDFKGSQIRLQFAFRYNVATR